MDGRCAIPFVWPAGAELIAKLVYGGCVNVFALMQCVCGEEGGSDACTGAD